MIPEQTLVDFPVFADSGTKIIPSDAKYANGFLPEEVLPAQWANYLFNKSSGAVTKLNAVTDSVQKELNNVVDAGGFTPSADTNDQVINAIKGLIATAKAEAILAAWPVGSIYIGTTIANPSTILGGGTWSAFGEGRCLIGVGNGNDGSRTRSFTANETGGEYAHVLTTGEMPSHTHTFTGLAVTSGGSSAANTGSTQPTFSGIPVDSEKNSEGHTHSIAHTHEYKPEGNITGGNHTHSYNKYVWAEKTYVPYFGTGTKWTFDTPAQTTGASGDNSTWTSKLKFEGTKATISSTATSSAESVKHTHSVTASGTVSSHSHTMAHTHSVTAAGTNASTGSGGSHNNLPPYITVYMWKRTA